MLDIRKLRAAERDGAHAAAEDDLLNAGDRQRRQIRIGVADQQPVEASAAIDALARGRLTAADEDGVVAVPGLDDVGSPLAAEDIVARASDEVIATGRAVESKNARDGLAFQAVGACEPRRDAERRLAAVLVRNGVEGFQLLVAEN